MNKVEFLSPSQIEEQEHLSLERLLELSSYYEEDLNEEFSIDTAKPKESFSDLILWAQNNFGKSLKGSDELTTFINNKIIIDGKFVKFCEDRGVFINCLYKESVISWRTDNNYEKFFMQGVFLIKHKDFEFIHCALFHKGNSNEDEISFFALVSNNNYEKYIKFRNDFDDWVITRDRSNLDIKVIDGEDISYEKDTTWDDLFLPENIKRNIKMLVDNFLASKDFYLKNKIPWKRGVLLYGAPGCGKSTIIKTIMSMYDFKPITIDANGNADSVKAAFAYAEKQSPSLLYFEDLDSLLERNVETSSFLNLLDGISTTNGMLVVATANDIRRLKASITDRPSRFDRKFEIPLPTQEMAYIYLNRWFGNIINSKKCHDISKYTTQNGFSYAYLKELYISSMFEALSKNRKTPNENDINNALNTLIKDKKILNGGTININQYIK